LQAESAPRTWTVGELVTWATDDFRTRGIVNPRLDAELLVARALETTRMQLIMDRDRPVVGAELALLRDLVKRRRAREPIAYIFGEREFYGRVFTVDPRVLIPRPDTETLVEVALQRTRHASMYARVLDLCTGSGCVAITLARQRPTTRVTAADLSEDALAVARENALRLGAYNVDFARGDLFEAVRKGGAPPQYELVTANPPYIAAPDIAGLDADIRDFEPRLALDGGDDGLALARRIVDEALGFLVPGGVLAMEIGFGQAEVVAKAFEAHGFADVRAAKDYGGVARVVSGVRA
jgi:release factor glutamine methyltransferase